MKQNAFTKLLAAGAACALALGTALAQDSSSTTSVTAGGAGVSTTTSSSTMDGTGTITAYTPSSDYITFRTQASAEPTRYYFTKQTTVVDPEGNTVQMSMLRPDMPVHYTYMKEGGRMVVTKVTLEKPISYYKKTSTTTTTTNP
ncbi:MAG TPA: hypothetical protein VGF73_09270 [Chthoniobacterales bacterium]|jgi:hypothetical protein